MPPAATLDPEAVEQSYIGNMVHPCQFCEALLFHDENSTCCQNGRVTLPRMPALPNEIANLLNGDTEESRHFRTNVRRYNSVLSMSSMNANYDRNLANMTAGAYTYRISGSVYHQLADVDMRMDGNTQFGNVYLLDPADQVRSRTNIFHELRPAVLRRIQDLLFQSNPCVQLYRQLGERLDQNPVPIQIRLLANPAVVNSQLPTVDEIAMIFDGEEVVQQNPRELLIEARNDIRLHYVSELHPLYDPLQYVLLFPFGTLGWTPDFLDDNDRRTTAMQFYRYHLYQRGHGKCLLNFGNLTHQFIVDMAAKIEMTRLQYIRHNQDRIHAQLYEHDEDDAVILPSSFIGSQRYMKQCYLDGMAIVRKYGKPDLFVTMTTNPRWSEITDSLGPNERPSDRPDIVARVFQLKLKELIHAITVDKVFGEVLARVHVIEFQKRGLPHAHLLITLVTKISTVEEIDRYISAEIPNADDHPTLHAKVMEFMVHNPCADNAHAVCKVNGICQRGFPKSFNDATIESNSGSITYRRRDLHRVQRNGIDIGSEWVVPYNPYLLQRFNCHLNVEICGHVEAIKYLYKYIYKGNDVIQATLNNADEIEAYIQGRYLSASEGTWRIYGFQMNRTIPAVVRLDIHLPNGPYVHRLPGHTAADIQRLQTTTLRGWFNLNRDDEFARTLLYTDVPSSFVWNEDTRQWTRRRTRASAIGRVHFIQPHVGELFYLRLMLHHIRGPVSFENLRTWNGIQYETFEQTARAAGLLANDDDWAQALQEAGHHMMPVQLRSLFATLLLFCSINQPYNLWLQFQHLMIQDFEHARRANPVQLALKHVNTILRANGRSLENFPDFPNLHEDLILHPLDEYFASFGTRQELQDAVNATVQSLNGQQTEIFTEIVTNATNNDPKKIFFINGSGGCGKTFLYNAVIGHLYCLGRKCIVVSSTGISSSILHGGRTAHSFFKIPLSITDTSVCTVSERTKRLIRDATLIVWDEAATQNKLVIQAVDRLCRSIMVDVNANFANLLFGGKLFVFGGDWKQTLPIVPFGSVASTVLATLKFWEHWNQFEQRNLTVNMRALSDPEYAAFLEDVGNGTNMRDNTNLISIPPELGIVIENSNLQSLIDFVFPGLGDANDFQERAILTVRNEDAQAINATILDRLAGNFHHFYSVDSIDNNDLDDSIHERFPIEFLNAQQPSGVPPHELKLQVGMPVMLLRNLDPSHGLCNGTILSIISVGQYVLHTEIVNGRYAGTRHHIPRIKLLSHDVRYPFTLARIQFPVTYAFAMTINKAQGQTLRYAGVDLRKHVFSHGQLYVALSRVRHRNNIRILWNHPNNDNVTANVIFRAIYQ